ncbi:MAG: hypothetical protein Kow0090_19180 [Myxococcota bacterium]
MKLKLLKYGACNCKGETATHPYPLQTRKISILPLLLLFPIFIPTLVLAKDYNIPKKPPRMKDYVTVGEFYRGEQKYTSERIKKILKYFPPTDSTLQYILPLQESGSDGRPDILHYDSDDNPTAIIELEPKKGDYADTRFSNLIPCRVKAVHIFTAGEPTELTLRIWADEGNYIVPDILKNLAEPITFTSRDKEWNVIELSQPIEFPIQSTFHVAVQYPTDGGAKVTLDGDGNTEERSLYRSKADDIFYLMPGDWSVRLEVEYFNEVEEFWFEEFTEKSGYLKDAGMVAFGDYDNDGYDDILISGCILLRNNRDMTFADISDEAELTGAPCGRGVWADYDNDGWLDFFTAGGEEALWRNLGDGSFERIPKELAPNDEFPTEGVIWVDYDRDGFVDLYLANYEIVGESGELGDCTRDGLWRNNGDGSFTNVTDLVGMNIKDEKGDDYCGRGVTTADFNGDGWQDIYVANYRLDRNLFWVNKEGFFEEMAEYYKIEGVKRSSGGDWAWGHTIGCQWGDLDNDEDWDLFCANLAHPRFIHFSDQSKVYISSGGVSPSFTEIYETSGIAYAETLSDPSLGDVDNDGVLDLFVTAVYEYRPSFLYKGLGDGTFKDVNYESGAVVYNGWGGAMADLDNDGRLEIASKRLFHNRGAKDKNWVEIKLIGVETNRSAIGSEVRVFARDKIWLRQVEGGKGTGSQSSLTLHFGLGYEKTIDEVQIKWLSGLEESYYDLEPNRIYYFTEGDTIERDADDEMDFEGSEFTEDDVQPNAITANHRPGGCSCKLRF